MDRDRSANPGHGAEGPEEGDAAAEAFERLRGELALMRRAVERLSAERADAPPQPDYAETLGVISHNLAVTAQRIDVLAKSPALSATPEKVGVQIATAATAARREDRDMLALARTVLDQATRELVGTVRSARRADEQNLWLAGSATGGVVVGLALWAALAGPIARAAPESWHWREERAARAMDMPMWQAGGQLLATADPVFYGQIIADEQIARANRDTITGCQKAAKRAGGTVRCTIRVGTVGK